MGLAGMATMWLWAVVAAAGGGPAGPARPASRTAGDPEDVKFLLEGVRQIAAPGVPGPLCVYGPEAFAVAVGGAGRGVAQPVVAAGRLKQGRIVALGQDGYLGRAALGEADTARLLLNAVRWAGGPRAKQAPLRVAALRADGLAEALKGHGLDVTTLSGPEWHKELAPFQVLCAHPGAWGAAGGDAGLAAVRRFVEAGGGLVAGDLGWGWLQLHPGKDLLRDHPGNRLLAAAGIVWADGYLERTCPAGFRADSAPPGLCHAGKALEALVRHAEGRSKLAADDLAQAGSTVSLAARSIPSDDPFLRPRLGEVMARYADRAVPSPRRPLGRDQALERVVLAVQLRQIEDLPPERVVAHPAAATFPGAVPPEAPRITQSVEVDLGVPDWHSTGLYAPAGEAISVETPAEAAAAGLSVRIGCHSDELWHLDGWQRCPQVCRRAPLRPGLTRLASPFGGLVYVEVPRGAKGGTAGVKIAGAVAAPYYVLGRTDLAAWRSEIRRRPAPWAELACERVILTLPAQAIRGLDDPQGVMEFWQRVEACCGELAGRPPRPVRPERYVCDVQISAGYMHSGCPIMTLLDMPEVMVDVPRMKRNGHGGVWGLFHELGHNHQSSDWTFQGTGEVTVNLFTLYVFEQVCGLGPEAHPAVSRDSRSGKLKAYLAAGAPFEQWQKDPFLALIMYIQLREAFGWEAYKKVFAEYRDLPREQRPRSDQQKRDQWLIRFSQAVGRNLGPFFQAWGVPTSQGARASVASLPVWMPEGLRPATAPATAGRPSPPPSSRP